MSYMYRSKPEILRNQLCVWSLDISPPTGVGGCQNALRIFFNTQGGILVLHKKLARFMQKCGGGIRTYTTYPQILRLFGPSDT